MHTRQQRKFVPFGSATWRVGSNNWEFMRPVSRTNFCHSYENTATRTFPWNVHVTIRELSLRPVPSHVPLPSWCSDLEIMTLLINNRVGRKRTFEFPTVLRATKVKLRYRKREKRRLSSWPQRDNLFLTLFSRNLRLSFSSFGRYYYRNNRGRQHNYGGHARVICLLRCVRKGNLLVTMVTQR